MSFRGWIPLVLLTVLILAVGAFTAVRQDAFLTEYNINNLLLSTMPLALVSIGQTNALLVGGFDISVAALVTMCVVIASFTLTPDETSFALFLGVARDRGRRSGDRRLQRDPHPHPPSPIDHRDARHLQHPRGRVAAAAGSSRGPDQRRRHRRAHDEHRLHAGRVHRRRRTRRARRCLAVSDAHGHRGSRSRSRRDVVAPARDVDRAHRLPRLRRLLGDCVDRRLLPRGAGPDRLPDHRRLRHSRASPRPSSAARASREDEDRSSGRCWRRSSSR